ncbi:MAG: hypothetical protein ACK4RK_13470 [Gemmataceae bacterium]
MTVLWLATCAPVDKPLSPEHPADRGPAPTAAETLPLPPTPLARGPQERIAAAIEHVWQRDLLLTHGFWTVFHGILGLGPDVTLRDPNSGMRVNALDYIFGGGQLRGLVFVPTTYGLDVPWAGAGPVEAFVAQGHQDQFISEMGQWGTPADKKVFVFGKEYTFLDFCNHSKMRASTVAKPGVPKQELSWTVTIVAQYYGTDHSWVNAHGEELTLEDLVRYELDEPIESAACGGTHRLFGLCWAYHLHLQNGGQTEGVWKEVADKMAKYRDIAKKYQNADGSFSTNFFRGPGNATSKETRINTTGHILEWLALTLTDEELKQEWMQSAANALALMILDSQNDPVDGGSLYHAVHGLNIYYTRLYGPLPNRREPMIPLPPAPAPTPVASGS